MANLTDASWYVRAATNGLAFQGGFGFQRSALPGSSLPPIVGPPNSMLVARSAEISTVDGRRYGA